MKHVTTQIAQLVAVVVKKKQNIVAHVQNVKRQNKHNLAVMMAMTVMMKTAIAVVVADTMIAKMNVIVVVMNMAVIAVVVVIAVVAVVVLRKKKENA